MKRTFFISTAIDYPSTAPHLGHAYEKVCADVIARFKRLRGFEVHFSTGTDEHGLKIQRCAEKAGERPKEFVDRMSQEFRKLCDGLNISYDDFIRTTEERHAEVVRRVFEKLHRAGDVYKGFYEGPYCTECETFYTDEELVDGKCPVHRREAERVKEECYFFRMGKYKREILDRIERDPDFIQPEGARNEILRRLKEPLRDLCISRTDFDWGIPLPLDEKHVLYVWVDALTNYLTTVDYPTEKFEKFWPADLHLIGKDISWHHCVIWSALLLSLGLQLPKRIFIHGFVTYRGEKLSKSAGLVIDPLHLAKVYSADALRYFLVREISFGQDGAFSEAGLRARLNDELADVLGNFAHRVLTFTWNRFGGEVPKGEIDAELEREVKRRVEDVEGLLERLRLTQALERVISIAALGNEYFQSSRPWETLKTHPEKAANCILNCSNLVKVLRVVLQPFLPATSEELARQLGLERVEWAAAKRFDLRAGHAIRKPKILFVKVQKQNPPEAVSLEEFNKLDLRIAEVVKAERIPGSEKMLKLELGLGDEHRTVVAGIGKSYSPSQLIGKRVVLVANLEPKKMLGVDSKGMVLAAGEEGEISLLTVDKPVESDTKVR